jgi:fructose-bisphosphate aldolase class I
MNQKITLLDNVFLEGMLLKPNMVTPGSTNPNKSKVTPSEIGLRSALAFSRTVPPAVPGIMVDN